MKEITLTPTDEGYANMVAMMADSILRDVKVARQDDARKLMSSLIEITAFLGSRQRTILVNDLVARYDPEARIAFSDRP